MAPVPEPCDLVATDLQDLTDPLSEFPKSPGADSKSKQVGDETCFRTTSFPGPSTLPFSELYERRGHIKGGGFGTVYKGIRKSDGQQVAIKFLNRNATDRYITVPGVSEPLLAEVALNLLLNEPPLSPYIVHMIDWFKVKDQHIIIMEYPQPCEDLFDFIYTNNVTESRARSLIYQAVLGAKHCLDRGVFHRDIKLDNFLINTATSQVKLIDFGCGDLVKDSYENKFIAGFHPPEYILDSKYKAEPTTVWTLGIAMYAMVNRLRSPFKTLGDEKRGILSLHSRISREFQDLITRCLAPKPDKRATIEEILLHEWFQRDQMSGATVR